jgi:hypothetical protein
MDSTISTKDLKSKLDKKQGITVVETLAPERYREAHIPHGGPGPARLRYLRS